MATFYIDHEAGNNNYSGDSFAVTISGADGVTNGTTLFSSAVGTFTSAVTGRYININTKGFYYIAAAPSTTTLTLSAIPNGTALPTTGSTLTYYIGGRWKDYANPNLSNGKPVLQGDTLRIKSTPVPTLIGNGSWTNNTKTIILADKVIENVEQCESGWVASSNVTATYNIGKDGGNYVLLTIAAGFTTGKVAYKPLTTLLNLSSYGQLSFQFRNSVSQTSPTIYRLCLCSDDIGNVVQDYFDIPTTQSINYSQPLTLLNSLSTTLANGISSVSLSAIRTPGACVIGLDNIVACLSSTDNRSINLQSLISKNNNHPNDHWWCIRYLSAGPVTQTVVGLDVNTPANGNQNTSPFKGYPYITETVPTYKCETYKVGFAPNGGVQTGPGGLFAWNGSSTGFYTPNRMTITGGWDRTDMSTQIHKTFYDGLDCNGNILNFGNTANIDLYNLGTVRAYAGISLNRYINVYNIESHACNYPMILQSTGCILSGYKGSGSFANLNIGGGNNISVSNCKFYNITLDNGIVYNHQVVGEYYNYYENMLSLNSSQYNIWLRMSNSSVYNGVTATGDVNGLFYYNNNDNTVFYNLSSRDNTIAFGNFGDAVGNNTQSFSIQGFNGVQDDIRTYMYGGMVLSEYGALRRTPSGYAWKMMINSDAVNQSLQFPYQFKIASVAARANTPVRITGYMRTNTVSNSGGIMCLADPYSGITETRGYASLSANAYVPVTVTVTSTKDTVIPFYFFGYINTSIDYLIIDDISVQ